MKKLTKEQVYVLIDNQPDCDRAIEILTKAVEPMWKDSTAFLLKEDKRYLKTYEDMDWGISYDNEDRTRVTLDELERILMPKIKKAELLERIEKLEEYVKELIDNPKVTVVHPPTWANDPGTVIGKGTIEIIEEPQYKEGTLGAFWDGEWEDAVCKRIAYLGTLEGKTKCDQFILKEANMCYLNFKPLKFD